MVSTDQSTEPQPGPIGFNQPQQPRKKATVGEKLPKETLPANLYFKVNLKELED